MQHDRPGGDPDAATWTVEVVSNGVTSEPVSGSFGWTECVLADGTSCRAETSATRIQVTVTDQGEALEGIDVALDSCGLGSAAGTPGTCTDPGVVFSAAGTTDADGEVLFDNAPEGLATGHWRVTAEETESIRCGDPVTTITLSQGQTANVAFACGEGPG